MWIFSAFATTFDDVSYPLTTEDKHVEVDRPDTQDGQTNQDWKLEYHSRSQEGTQAKDDPGQYPHHPPALNLVGASGLTPHLNGQPAHLLIAQQPTALPPICFVITFRSMGFIS